MSRFLFLYHTSSTNLGHVLSSPGRYFPNDLPECHKLDIAHTDLESIAHYHHSVPLIIGGGDILSKRWDSLLKQIVSAEHRRRIIVWGAGRSAEGELPGWLDNVSLVGVRDYDMDQPWVPCASCMHPAFSHIDRPKPRMRAVAFMKADIPHRVVGIPVMLSNQVALTNVISFMWQAQVVVTNSYYGVYWATLAGCGVVCIPREEAFEKFMNFRHSPIFSNPDTWRQKLKSAPFYPEALQQCREATLNFAKQVKKMK